MAAPAAPLVARGHGWLALAREAVETSGCAKEVWQVLHGDSTADSLSGNYAVSLLAARADYGELARRRAALTLVDASRPMWRIVWEASK